MSELFHKHEGKIRKVKGQGGDSRTISEHELNKKSERNINIQVGYFLYSIQASSGKTNLTVNPFPTYKNSTADDFENI